MKKMEKGREELRGERRKLATILAAPRGVKHPKTKADPCDDRDCGQRPPHSPFRHFLAAWCRSQMAKGKKYTAKDLQGLKVGHEAADFREGDEVGFARSALGAVCGVFLSEHRHVCPIYISR